jgi:hypothetical protein
MKLLPMNRSGLRVSQRIKAMIPLIVSVIALGSYLCVVNWRQEFAVHFIPNRDRIFYEKMIFAGLDRIRSSGWKLSWDRRHGELEWIVQVEAARRGATNTEYEKVIRQEVDEGIIRYRPPSNQNGRR